MADNRESRWYDDWSAGGTGYGRNAPDFASSLAPLLAHLCVTDALREQLENDGGTTHDAIRLTELLQATIVVETPWGRVSVILSEPKTLRTCVRDWSQHGLKIQVRRTRSGLPAYHVSRTRTSWRVAGGCVLECLHASAGFPGVDARFVLLTGYGGKESRYARLDRFRERMAELHPTLDPGQLDRHLGSAWEWVLAPAWHDDQRVAVVAAECFDLPLFREATEFLYLALTTQLCDLREAIDDDLVTFFIDIYPRPAIVAFLEHVRATNGSELDAIPEIAIRQYARLGAAFSRFLQTTIAFNSQPLPVYKALFSQLLADTRLGLDSDELAEPIAQLEEDAARTLELSGNSLA